MVITMKKYIYLLLAIITHFCNISQADQWDDVRERGLESGKTYDISSGTGFYVAPGYILTNQHVVSSCLTISVRGAVDPAAANLVSYDKNADLALLKTDTYSPRIASFRHNEGLSAGGKVFVMGYPLEHANDGMYLVRDANIISMDNQVEETKQIEFTAIIEKGNSGGPLIDTSGNVVGIVQAKKNYYYLSSNSNEINPQATPYQVHGLAIGLTSIERFLTSNNVNYSISDSYTILSNYQPDLQAKDYIVNIHCVKDKTD
ncbi:Serine protease [Candidatus Arcanobacter lacustris]|uniref:Serine protease n=1 Tax=Candidatus Arcanibacter lacustris TaxID=1607817 RepID=A0A0F5MQ82_9RICK|nr:Serine protease [Candidatus Arcanobacter lacustris]